MKKTIELFGKPIEAEFVEWKELRKRDVRYIGTDFEYSELDVYEDSLGEIYATKL